MKGKIVKKICIVIVAILIILGSYNVVNALTESELEQKRIELNLKIEEAGKNIEGLEVELTQNVFAKAILTEDIKVNGENKVIQEDALFVSEEQIWSEEGSTSH